MLSTLSLLLARWPHFLLTIGSSTWLNTSKLVMRPLDLTMKWWPLRSSSCLELEANWGFEFLDLDLLPQPWFERWPRSCPSSSCTLTESVVCVRWTHFCDWKSVERVLRVKLWFMAVLGTAKPPVLGTEKPLVLGTRKPQILTLTIHSALRRNLMKVWKTWTGPSLGGRAWSRGLKSALSKILQNKEHFH